MSNLALDTVEGLDRPWDERRIKLLVDGYCAVGDELHTETSAFELRTRALGGGDLDLVLDHAQLVRAIRSIRDKTVRNAMLLRVFTGEDEYEIQLLLSSRRAGHHLLSRGRELVRRYEGGQHASKRRKLRGLGDGPVCWRCMNALVERPGDECDEFCEPKRRAGRPGGLEGRKDAPVEDMTLDELVATQDEPESYKKWNRKLFSGGSTYANNVFPAGVHIEEEKDWKHSSRRKWMK